MKKIYCELTDVELDSMTLKEVAETIGWVEYDTKTKTWDVNTRDGGSFSCKEQEIAHTMANTEMILAMLMRK